MQYFSRGFLCRGWFDWNCRLDSQTLWPRVEGGEGRKERSLDLCCALVVPFPSLFMLGFRIFTCFPARFLREFSGVKMNFMYHLLKTDRFASLHWRECFVSIERVLGRMASIHWATVAGELNSLLRFELNETFLFWKNVYICLYSRIKMRWAARSLFLSPLICME